MKRRASAQDRMTSRSNQEGDRRSHLKALRTVKVPPRRLRDQRELFRTRMVLTQQRTRLKNRIHATLSKYGLGVEGATDAFGKRGRLELDGCLGKLPEHTRFGVERLLEQLDMVMEQVTMFEKRMREVFEPTEEPGLLRTLPGVGLILGVVIQAEVGEVERFPSAEHLASYAGTRPRIHASGGKVRYGRLRADVNHYLKWAFIEAANVVCAQRSRYSWRHVSRLYERIRERKGHQTAVGAVARHLAEATYWTLSKGQKYQKPSFRPRKDKRVVDHESN